MGIVVASFLLAVKGNTEQKAKEYANEKFAEDLLEDVYMASYRACEYGESTMIISSKDFANIDGKMKKLCVGDVKKYCRDVEMKCSLNYNFTLASQKYKIVFENDASTIRAKVEFWQ